jgi:ABC-type uncharacterized transport system substrate-binding protein
MFDPDTSPFFGSYLRSFNALKQPFLGEIEAAPVRNVAEIEETVGKLGRETGSGLIAPSDVFVNDQRDVIIKSALQYGVPMISVYRGFVVGGGLIAYGPDTSDIFAVQAPTSIEF